MIVYFTIILIVLLGFCGLAVDIGRMELRTNQLQAAADAAALAAAGELQHASSTSNWQTAADNDVAAFEIANNIPSTTPTTLVLGPTYGPYIGDSSVVQATVTQSFRTIFLGLLSHANASITLTAKAQAQIPPCIFFSGNPNYSGTDAFWVTSSGVDIQGSWACPLYTQTGTSVDYFSHYNGSQTRSSAGAASSSFGGTWSPPIYNVPVLSDPLAYVTAPVTGTCTNASPISKLNQPNGASLSFTPGTYCGKIGSFTPGPGPYCESTSTIIPAMDVEGTYVTPNFTGVGCPSQSGGGNLNYANGGNCTSNPTVTFAPGLYVFIGGVNFTCVTLSGNGVTMYFTKSGSVGYGQMRMTSTTWKVNAPTDPSNGGIPGISIMNDRNWIGSADDFQWWYSSWYADGVVYLTGTGIFNFNMPMYAPNYLNIVAANMYDYLGNIKPAVNYGSLPAGNPLHTVVTLVQ